MIAVIAYMAGAITGWGAVYLTWRLFVDRTLADWLDDALDDCDCEDCVEAAPPAARAALTPDDPDLDLAGAIGVDITPGRHDHDDDLPEDMRQASVAYLEDLLANSPDTPEIPIIRPREGEQ